jgi:predicted transcriptional regulator
MRKRRLSANKSEAFRQNSFNRIYIEGLIISILRDAPKPLPNRVIYELLTKEHVEIKDTTFRALLFRMKEKGILESRNRKWHLAQQKTAS